MVLEGNKLFKFQFLKIFNSLLLCLILAREHSVLNYDSGFRHYRLDGEKFLFLQCRILDDLSEGTCLFPLFFLLEQTLVILDSAEHCERKAVIN